MLKQMTLDHTFLCIVVDQSNKRSYYPEATTSNFTVLNGFDVVDAREGTRDGIQLKLISSQPVDIGEEVPKAQLLKRQDPVFVEFKPVSLPLQSYIPQFAEQLLGIFLMAILQPVNHSSTTGFPRALSRASSRRQSRQ